MSGAALKRPKALTFVQGKANDVLIPEVVKKLGFREEEDLAFEKKGDKVWLVTTKEKAELLRKAKEKIDRIREDMLHSEGLTQEEVRAAIDTGWIPEDQGWWWLESWQKREREVERDKLEGKFETFPNVEEAIKYLDTLKNAD